jgi:oligosaccharide reducing-end xylanase
MKTFRIILFLLILFGALNLAYVHARHDGSYCSKKYQNLFKELLNKSDSEIKEKVYAAFNQLFYGSDDLQRIYYPVENEMAYIEDVNYKDVRTEGMSYGLMVTVQLDKKNEFDRLWKWTKTFMQHQSGQRKDYFAWHCKLSGEVIDSGSASDGEEWIVTDLFLASARWGDGEGIYNHQIKEKLLLTFSTKRKSRLCLYRTE